MIFLSSLTVQLFSNKEVVVDMTYVLSISKHKVLMVFNNQFNKTTLICVLSLNASSMMS